MIPSNQPVYPLVNHIPSFENHVQTIRPECFVHLHTSSTTTTSPTSTPFFSRQKMRFRSPWFKPSPKKLKKLRIGVVFCWLFFAWFGFLGEIFLKIGLDCFDVSECLVVLF